VTEPEPVDADQEPAAFIVAGICARDVPERSRETTIKIAACFKYGFEVSIEWVSIFFEGCLIFYFTIRYRQFFWFAKV
jgi:hypothetical protein